jgi:hypothetical protein
LQKQVVKPNYEDYPNDKILGLPELNYLEYLNLIRMMTELSKYPETSQIIMREEKGIYIELLNALLLSKDKHIVVESLNLIGILFSHNRFPELFVEKDGLKAFLKISNEKFYQFSLINFLQILSTKTLIMENISSHAGIDFIYLSFC